MEEIKAVKTCDDELNEIIDSAPQDEEESVYEEDDYFDSYEDEDEEDDDMKAGSICQWMTDDDTQFCPAGKTVKELPPGMYAIFEDPRRGIVFDKVPIKTQGLLKLSGTDSSEVCSEISDFWGKEDRYRAHKIAYKRGILLWGPPGTGKSCTLQLVVEDVVARGGICVIFDDPYAFRRAMRRFREIQKDTPVVVIMEDIDSTIEEFSETEVLNILDGLENVDKMVFLATTNHPEKLGHRICNRPSRFDRRFKIDFPTKDDRRTYLESLNVEGILDATKIRKWVKDTEGFTFAHIKELFVSVAILGNQYNSALDGLRRMKNNPSKEGKKSAGFATDDDE